MTVLFGPILQFRGLTNQNWQISALVVTDKDAGLPTLSTIGALNVQNIKILAQVPFNNPRYDLHRIDFFYPKTNLSACLIWINSSIHFIPPALLTVRVLLMFPAMVFRIRSSSNRSILKMDAGLIYMLNIKYSLTIF